MDEIEAARREIDELTEEGADAIIAIVHLGVEVDVPCDSTALANAMTGEYSGKLDVIIAGHSHTAAAKKVNGILIAQTGNGLVNLGKITLRFGENGGLDTADAVLAHEEVVAITAPDAEVEAEIEAITSGMMGLLTVPVVQSSTTLWGGTIDGVAEAYVVETNPGSFAADAYRNATEQFIAQAPGMEEYHGLPVIGVENGGSGHAVLAELPLIGEIGGELETYLIRQANDAVLPHQNIRGLIIPAGDES